MIPHSIHVIWRSSGIPISIMVCIFSKNIPKNLSGNISYASKGVRSKKFIRITCWNASIKGERKWPFDWSECSGDPVWEWTGRPELFSGGSSSTDFLHKKEELAIRYFETTHLNLSSSDFQPRNRFTCITCVHTTITNKKNKEPPAGKTFFDSKIAFPITQRWFVSCLLRTAFICPYHKLFISLAARNVHKYDKCFRKNFSYRIHKSREIYITYLLSKLDSHLR